MCGVQDLKQSVFAGLARNSLIRFSKDFGGETNLYQGFDVNIESRFRNGAFLRGGIAATARTFDNCNLLVAGNDAVPAGSTEIYADGTTGCHREYGYRPDAKFSGSYTLPWDVQLGGTYQFTRGVQTGGAGPSITASWTVTNAVALQQLGRNWQSSAASRTVQLMAEGTDYGKNNLNQLDIKLAKRFTVDKVRLRVDFDLYNVFNSSWPYTVTTTYSTAATSQYLRPTNVLQNRFFKLGGHISF